MRIFTILHIAYIAFLTAFLALSWGKTPRWSVTIIIAWLGAITLAVCYILFPILLNILRGDTAKFQELNDRIAKLEQAGQQPVQPPPSPIEDFQYTFPFPTGPVS